MSGNYVKESTPGVRINEAMLKIKIKEISICKASERYSMEQTLLFRKMHYISQGVQGRKLALSKEDKNIL